MSSQKKVKKKVKINTQTESVTEDGSPEELAAEEKKPKKVKVTYYDDNSTVIDMSMANRKGVKKDPPPKRVASPRGARWKTFWGAVRKMLIPMFIFIIILAVVFLCMYGIGRCAQNQLDSEASAAVAICDDGF